MEPPKNKQTISRPPREVLNWYAQLAQTKNLVNKMIKDPTSIELAKARFRLALPLASECIINACKWYRISVEGTMTVNKGE
jgi:hypothetical protein